MKGNICICELSTIISTVMLSIILCPLSLKRSHLPIVRKVSSSITTSESPESFTAALSEGMSMFMAESSPVVAAMSALMTPPKSLSSGMSESMAGTRSRNSAM